MAKNKTLACSAAILAFGCGVAAAAPARTEADLNMRSGPGTGSGVVAVIPRGAVVNATDCGGGWCRVRYRGEVGYASRNYLDFGATAGIAPPAVVDEYYDAPAYYYDYGYYGPDYDYYGYYGPGIGFSFSTGPRWYGWRHRHAWRGWHGRRVASDSGMTGGGRVSGGRFRCGGTISRGSFSGAGSVSRGGGGARVSAGGGGRASFSGGGGGRHRGG
jgi:hypothetical protein